MSDDNKPYEVGYGKPPKKHQFKKGKSGNPKGREKGSKNFGVLFHEELKETVVISGTGKRITKQEAIVKGTVADAMKGNARAREKIFEIFSSHFKDIESNLKKLDTDKLDKQLEKLSDEELDELCRLLKKLGVAPIHRG